MINLQSAQCSFMACLTPAGTGAISVLGLHGPQVWNILQEVFVSRAGKLLPDPGVGPLWLGKIGVEVAEHAVLMVRRVQPLVCEIHCHGGRAAVRYLQDVFAERGLASVTPEEFTYGTSPSRISGAAKTALACALTFRTSAILLDQVGGAFENKIVQIREAGEARPDEAERLLRDLQTQSAVGRHLTKPFRVAIAGAPNVGKSSLANALAGYARCVVTPIPGTTRDVVTTMIAVDGWPVELADTAGLRAEGDSLEKAGMALARRAVESADLCLWVLDGSRPPVWPDSGLHQHIFVVNKSDLPPAWDWAIASEAAIVSAQSGMGMVDLCLVVAKRLVPLPPPPGAAVPFTPELCDIIDSACQLLSQGRSTEDLRLLLRMTDSNT